MENVFKSLVAEIKRNIVCDLHQYLGYDGKLLKLVLDAYNTYQKEEREGVDYIFDINNPDDLQCCIAGGMTAKEVAWLYEQSQVNTTPFFYFGVNYQQPKPIVNYKALVTNLINWLDEILPCVLAYSYLIKSYEKLYKVCVTDYMINNQLVP